MMSSTQKRLREENAVTTTMHKMTTEYHRSTIHEMAAAIYERFDYDSCGTDPNEFETINQLLMSL